MTSPTYCCIFLFSVFGGLFFFALHAPLSFPHRRKERRHAAAASDGFFKRLILEIDPHKLK